MVKLFSDNNEKKCDNNKVRIVEHYTSGEIGGIVVGAIIGTALLLTLWGVMRFNKQSTGSVFGNAFRRSENN
jgi:hypothetical protein